MSKEKHLKNFLIARLAGKTKRSRTLWLYFEHTIWCASKPLPCRHIREKTKRIASSQRMLEEDRSRVREKTNRGMLDIFSEMK